MVDDATPKLVPPPLPPSADAGRYAVASASVTLGGFSEVVPAGTILVIDDVQIRDQNGDVWMWQSTLASGVHVDVALDDLGLKLTPPPYPPLTSGALPLQLDPADFANPHFLVFRSSGVGLLGGAIDSITTQVVPEPAPALFLLLGLGLTARRPGWRAR